jgi:hypothetical protein
VRAGISIWNAEPLPTAASTQMRPPCISSRADEVITGFVAGAVWVPISDAQQPKQVAPKLAIVGSLAQGSSSSPTLLADREAYEQGLRKEGYVDWSCVPEHNSNPSFHMLEYIRFARLGA